MGAMSVLAWVPINLITVVFLFDVLFLYPAFFTLWIVEAACISTEQSIFSQSKKMQPSEKGPHCNEVLRATALKPFQAVHSLLEWWFPEMINGT